MRSKLKAIAGEKFIFTATLTKFAAKKGKTKITVALLHDLKLNGVLMCDHLWLPKHWFSTWMIGGCVTFRGKVVYYRKNHPVQHIARDLTIDSIKVLHCDVAEEI